MTAQAQRGRAQHGQATVEFVALLLLCCLTLGALFALKASYVSPDVLSFVLPQLDAAQSGIIERIIRNLDAIGYIGTGG